MSPDRAPSPAPRASTPRGRSFLLLTLGGLAAALTAMAAVCAWSTRGAPFPALLVDATCSYSIIEMPTWRNAHLGLTIDDRLVKVRGTSLPKGPCVPEEAYQRMGADPTVLTFEGPGGARDLEVPVRHLGTSELLFFFATYVLAAWEVLWSGGLVLLLSGRPAARRAHAFWSVATFLLLLTLYDNHTTARLAPLFSVATIGLPLGALWLAYAFPTPPARGAVGLRRLLTGLSVLGAAAALYLVVARFTGWSTAPVKGAVDGLLGPCIATLPVAMLLRLRGARGLERAELVTASWGLILAPLLIALLHGLSLATGSDMRHVLLPLIVLLFPLSIGYAMVRNNILETRLVLSPGMLRVPLLLSALLLSVLATSLIHLSARDGSLPWWVLGGALFLLLQGRVRRLQTRFFFPSTLAFRATVQALGDRLSVLRDAPALQRALEEAVVQAISTASARVLDTAALDHRPHLPPDAREQLAQGRPVWTTQRPREQHLLMPMRSRGELRAVLDVAPKREAALYTQEDLHLLETVASMGALALHNAESVQELESLRRLEVEAAHLEKLLTLSALSDEVCHEMMYPLNFLQDLLRRGTGGPPLDAEDLDFARKEVHRMEGLLESLRRLHWSPPRMESLSLKDPVQRVLVLLREATRDKQLSVSVELEPALTVEAEGDALVQLLSNLLRNAAQAAPPAGAIGIRAHQEAGRPIIEVWDTGPGIPDKVARVLFTRHRVSTKEGGHGVGLTVVQRIAYSFRWQISFRREADRTIFRLTLPQVP